MKYRLTVAFTAMLLSAVPLPSVAQLATPAPSSPASPPVNSITTLAPVPAAAAKIDTRLTAPAKAAGVVELDRIVAIVNNEVITLNDLNNRMAIVVKQLQAQSTQLPPQDALRKQLLERMINDMVQLQEAKETGIRVDDATLDKALQRIADENNLSMTEFRRRLEQDGVSWQKFREEVRGEVIMSRLREREVESGINVTEAEVDTQLSLEAREATTDREFRLAHILVLVPEQATSAQIETRRKRALQALGELVEGCGVCANFRAILRRARCLARRQSGLATIRPLARHIPGCTDSPESWRDYRYSA